MTNQDRPRIHSIITRSRFLHIEDALAIGKVRLFIGEYRRGSGAQATAYHFLDDADARVVFLDMAWARELDIKDYKGSNGEQPLSRVLTIRGPKEGKYWLEVQNGPGQVIGQGAVKPAGEPDVSISIALTVWEARKLALAVIEYMTAYRVATLTAAAEVEAPKVTATNLPNKTPTAPRTPPPMPKVEGETAGRSDVEDLFGTEEPRAGGDPPAARPKAEPEPSEGGPPAFYSLAPMAIEAGLLDLVNELVTAPGSWRDKAQRLQTAMAA